MSFIRCSKLTRTYMRGTEAITPLQDLDLEIKRGRFIALMGPSGSGKTTLLNLLAGIDSPTGGELHVGEHAVHAMSRSRLAAWRGGHVGYIFQLYNLVPVLTAYENVELPPLLQPLSRQQRHARVCAALDAVDMADRHGHYPRQLSGGQEQRVAIARAIVTEPDLLLADEPTGDLDRETGSVIMDLLKQLNQENALTIVMVTHDPATTKWADTLLHLEKGKLLEAAS